MTESPTRDRQFETLEVTIDGPVAWVTIDAGPINLLTTRMLVDLLRAGTTLAADNTLSVVVIQSANPEFFIAHYDVESLLSIDTPAPLSMATELNTFGKLCELYRTMDKITIAKIAGRVGGGGSEFAMACDMRFGALGLAVMNQMEVPLGILPGGGGTQRLVKLIGYARAAELILGGLDLDAATGERWGYFNRALEPEDLDRYVAQLAGRIAAFPVNAVRLAKEAMLAASADPVPGLLNESFLFAQLLGSPTAKERLAKFMAAGGQTAAVEHRIEQLADTL